MGLKQIAKKAGVSVSTVSLVLAGKGRVSEPVRKKVLDIARTLEYKRPLYEKMKTERKLLGILYHTDPEWSYVYEFIVPVINQLELILKNAGYTTLIIPYSYNEKPAVIAEKIFQAEVQGVFSIHYANKALFDDIENRGVPVVIINNLTYIDKFTTIGVDDFQGAYIGAKHLLELGHKNILYVDYKRDTMHSIVDDRFYGFLKAVNECGTEKALHRRLTVVNQKSSELTEKLNVFFSKNDRPTAIFAHDDYLALHIITALDKLGIHVPDNVSIIAPGDVLDYSEPFIPGITTIKIDTPLLGEIAADAMIKRLNNKNMTEPYSLRIKQQLTERSSCIPLTSTTDTA